MKWARKNLFNTWYNSLLTVACLWIIYQLLKYFIIWITGQAKWGVIQENFRLFLVGRYPESEYWRLWLVLIILATLTGLSWVRKIRNRMPVIWILSFPIILWLIGGGLGLSKVDTNLWNGLLLTILMAVTSLILSFPLGILLALGRTSQLPVVRWFSLIYIEVIRGLPLVGILFIAQVMLPLVLPPEIRLDRVLRAIAGLTLFSAAYIAENVRGGLQSIPRSQIEAAKALGLNPPLVVLLIILPQALRIALPSIVGQFIGLFKDTTLLSIVGLLELLGMARSILAQPEFIGNYAEVYLFVGLLYWLGCYGMSLASRRLEENLETSQKN